MYFTYILLFKCFLSLISLCVFSFKSMVRVISFQNYMEYLFTLGCITFTEIHVSKLLHIHISISQRSQAKFGARHPQRRRRVRRGGHGSTHGRQGQRCLEASQTGLDQPQEAPEQFQALDPEERQRRSRTRRIPRNRLANMFSDLMKATFYSSTP